MELSTKIFRAKQIWLRIVHIYALCLGVLLSFYFHASVSFAQLYYSPHEKMDTATVAFSPDGNHILSAGFDGDIRLWKKDSCELHGIVLIHDPRISQNEVRNEYPPYFSPRRGILSLAWSQDGTKFVFGLRDRTARLYSIDLEMPLEGLLFEERGIFHEHVGGLRAVAYSSDGKFIASAGHDKNILLWSAQEDESSLELPESSVKRICCSSGQVNALDFSSDGKLLVSGSSDGTVRIWDVSSGKELKVFEMKNDEFYSVKFSHNRNLIAASTQSHKEKSSIILWKVETGIEEMRFHGHNGGIWSVGFSPDGRFLASGGHQDGNINIWDLSSGKLVKTLIDPHFRSIRSLSFGPDGRYIVSGVTSGPLPLWNVKTGKIVREFGKCPSK